MFPDFINFQEIGFVSVFLIPDCLHTATTPGTFVKEMVTKFGHYLCLLQRRFPGDGILFRCERH